MTRRERYWFAALVLLALAIRLGAIAATPDLGLVSDPSDYARHARSIAAGHGYPPSIVAPGGGPTAIRPPAYPFLLAGVFKLTGDSVTAGRIAQAIVGAGVVALVGLVALELWGSTVALVAAGLAAVFPPFIIDGMTLLTEPLFVLLEMAAVVAVLRWRRLRRTRLVLAAGALCGLAVLTRANGALLLVALAIGLWRTGSWRAIATYRAPASLVATAVLVVAPWSIRNASEFSAFVPVTDQDGYTAAATYNATSRERDAIWLVPTGDPHLRRVIEASRNLDEAQLDAKLRSEVRRFIVDDPAYLFTVATRNALRLFNLAGQPFETGIARGDYGLGPNWARLMTFGFFPFLLLAIAGAFTRRARSAPFWLWLLPLLMLAPMMILAQNRVRAPIDPFLILLASVVLAPLSHRARALWSARFPQRPSAA